MWWGERDPGSRMTEADRLILRALTAYEAGLCACGHPRDEAWSTSHYAKAYGDDHMQGAYWVTQLVPRGKTIQT